MSASTTTVPRTTPRTAAPPPRAMWRELWRTALGCGLTVALFTLIFQPLTLWPAALVCLTPWTVVVVAARRAWIAYWLSVLAGYVFFCINLNWLYPVTNVGYLALAAYLALYWPLAAWAIRTGYRFGIGCTWTLPCAWVACEFLRGWVMSGFPWLFLAHSFYEQTTLIQISDVTGAFGVSFLVAMVNGLLADWLLTRARHPWTPLGRRQRWVATLATAVGVTGALAYGAARLANVPRTPGPLVSVVQHDFPLMSTPPYGEHPMVVFAKYLAVGAQAAADRPDVVVFPETVWNSTQNLAFLEEPLKAVDDQSAWTYHFSRLCHDATAAFARGDYAAVNTVLDRFEQVLRPDKELARLPGGRLPRLPAEGGPPVTVVMGAVSVEPGAAAGTASDRRRFNSALVYDADGVQRRQRYDKSHLVPFGEYVPFRNQRFLGINLHPLYAWLNSLSPFSRGGTVHYSLASGTDLTAFDLSLAGQTWRFGAPICYEDVMPRVIRRYVWRGGERRVDFLLNLSNDGWFLHSAELPQHLAICAFRAVENRVPIARSVNTGISGFIDSDGRVQSRLAPGAIGHLTQRLAIDHRASFYGRAGDWLAGACLLATAALWLTAIFTRWINGVRRWAQRRRARRA